jgi:hypothetical protein
MEYRRLLVPLVGAFALLATLAALVDASQPPTLAPLSQGWLYRYGDSPPAPSGMPLWALPEGLQSAGWSPAAALALPPGRQGADMLWLAIPLPARPYTQPAILFANMGNAAVEGFVEGQLVYRSGSVRPGRVERPAAARSHLVLLPPTAAGRTLVLRLQGHGPVLGVLNGAWYDEAHVLSRWALRSALPAWSIGCFALLCGLLLLVLLPLWRREESGPRLLGLYCTGSGMALAFFSDLPQHVFGQSPAWNLLTSIGAALCLPSLCHFMDRAILSSRPRLLRHLYLAAYALGLAAAILLALPLAWAPSLFTAWLLLMVLLLVLCVVLVTREALTGNFEARLFLGGLAMQLGAMALGLATQLGWVGMSPSTALLGFLGFVLVLLLLVVRRFLSVLRRSRQHAELLEARESEVLRMSQEMADGTARLSAAVQQMRETAVAQARTIDAQRISLHETQTTVEEIRQTSHLASQKAQAVLEDAERAEDLGRTGLAALQLTLAGLDAIRSEVEEVAHRLGALEERTHEVADIVEAVKDLADQSNLLAINASIEAARSGEEGQGFSVVASEMRNMADQSIRATLRIRQVLAAVGEEVRGTAGLSRRGQERVLAAVEQVRTSGEQLQELARIATDSGASARQIAASVGQQHHGVEQLTVALHDFARQMSEVLERLDQTQSAASSVQQVAELLGRSATSGSSAFPLPLPAPEPHPAA